MNIIVGKPYSSAKSPIPPNILVRVRCRVKVRGSGLGLGLGFWNLVEEQEI